MTTQILNRTMLRKTELCQIVSGFIIINFSRNRHKATEL